MTNPNQSTVVEPPVPPSVLLDADTRGRIIAGVKAVLARLTQKGLLKEADYAATVGSPRKLLHFIDTYRANRQAAADLVVDKNGKPVLEDDGELACAVTLAQIERLLVTTCARRVFAGVTPAKAAIAKGAAKQTFHPADQERKLEEIRPYLGYAWQLPLLESYALLLDRGQIRDLGADLLLVRDLEGLKAVAALDSHALRQARHNAGSEFRRVLATAPTAVTNLAWLPPKQMPPLRQALGGSLWRFCARDRGFVETVMGMDLDFVEAVGPVLADLPLVTVRALDRLPINRVRPFLNTFFAIFEDQSTQLLKDAKFGQIVLTDISAVLSQSQGTTDEFIEVAYLKLTALKGKIDSARDLRG